MYSGPVSILYIREKKKMSVNLSVFNLFTFRAHLFRIPFCLDLPEFILLLFLLHRTSPLNYPGVSKEGILRALCSGLQNFLPSRCSVLQVWTQFSLDLRRWLTSPDSSSFLLWSYNDCHMSNRLLLSNQNNTDNDHLLRLWQLHQDQSLANADCKMLSTVRHTDFRCIKLWKWLS